MKRTFVAAAAAASWLTLGFSCGPRSDPPPARTDACLEDEPAPPAEEQPMVVVGFGAGEAFRAIEEQAEITLERGPQGGSHLTATLRLFADGGPWSYDVTVEDHLGNVLSTQVLAVTSCADGWIESVNVRIFAEPAAGGLLRVEARPEQASEAAANFERTVWLL